MEDIIYESQTKLDAILYEYQVESELGNAHASQVLLTASNWFIILERKMNQNIDREECLYIIYLNVYNLPQCTYVYKTIK